MLVRSLVLALVTTGLLACSRPESPSPDAPSTTVVVPRGSAEVAASDRPPEARSMLRLDYTLTTTDPDKAPTTAEYTVNVEENQPGEIHLGRNIPLQTMPASSPPPGAHGPGPAGSALARPMMMAVPRQDVGMMLRCSYQRSGDDLTVRTVFELSDAIEDGSPLVKIAKVSLKGDAPLKAGQSSVVSTSEDPGSHRRYQLAVKATRLR